MKINLGRAMTTTQMKNAQCTENDKVTFNKAKDKRSGKKRAINIRIEKIAESEQEQKREKGRLRGTTKYRKIRQAKCSISLC